MNCGTGLPLPILYLSLGNIKYMNYLSLVQDTGPLPILYLSLGNIKYELWYRITTSYSLSLFRKH